MADEKRFTLAHDFRDSVHGTMDPGCLGLGWTETQCVRAWWSRRPGMLSKCDRINPTDLLVAQKQSDGMTGRVRHKIFHLMMLL